MQMIYRSLQWIKQLGLVSKIIIGIITGALLASASPEAGEAAGLFGQLFVAALKAVAPILVFFLVLASVANQTAHQESHVKPILGLYLFGTLAAAFTAVAVSFLFPVSLTLVSGATNATPPNGITEVLQTLLFKIVQNPVSALLEGNYIALVAWGAGLGYLLRHAAASTITAAQDVANAITGIVQVVIQWAPLGIFGLVAVSVAATGFSTLVEYSQLLGLLLGSMLFIALIINPIIVWFMTRTNPYPLVLTCLRESGVTAFFTRSSAANIPVNMQLCEKLDLDEDTYSVSIPLGATINMGGAAITITVMTLATVHTLGMEVDLATALLLSVVAALAACGASGVAGGSLLLIPLACGLFGIDDSVAMQVVAVGFIIGVVQDSAETALNSSTDVVFTAAVCRANQTNKA